MVHMYEQRASCTNVAAFLAGGWILGAQKTGTTAPHLSSGVSPQCCAEQDQTKPSKKAILKALVLGGELQNHLRSVAGPTPLKAHQVLFVVQT